MPAFPTTEAGPQPPTRSYDEKFSTKLSEEVARRLRLFVALQAGRIHEVVDTALDAYLPSLDELARAVNPAKNHRPGLQLTSEETH